MWNLIEIKFALYKYLLITNSFKYYFTVIITPILFIMIPILFILLIRMSKSRRQRFFINILLSFIALTISFLLFELIFRTTYIPETNFSTMPIDLSLHSYIYDQSDDCETKGVCSYMNILNNNFYSDLNETHDNYDNNIFKIVIIGDSFSQGVPHVTKEQAYPSQLEYLLNKSSNNLDYKVYNLGIGGLNTFQELKVLKDIGLNYKPDLLIVQYTPNDLYPTPVTTNMGKYMFLINPGENYVLIEEELILTMLPFSSNINFWILQKSYFIRFITKKVNAIYKKLIPRKYEEWETINKDALKEILSISTEENIPLILIYVQGTNPKSCKFSNIKRSEMSNLTLKKGLHFVDFCDYIKDEDALKFKNKNDCSICNHYSAEGYNILAKALFKNMKILGFV